MQSPSFTTYEIYPAWKNYLKLHETQEPGKLVTSGIWRNILTVKYSQLNSQSNRHSCRNYNDRLSTKIHSQIFMYSAIVLDELIKYSFTVLLLQWLNELIIATSNVIITS